VNKSSPFVFISYAREDACVADQLYTDLEQHDCRPWLDARKLLAGQNWKEEIDKAIHQSDFFIALFSQHSVNKRGFVQSEIREAIDILKTIPAGEIFFIPARIDDCEPSYPLLQDLHRLDLFPNWPRGLQQILDAIRSRNSIPSFDARLALFDPDEENLDTRYSQIRDLVVSQLASLLNFPADQIQEQASLWQLGVDSLMFLSLLSGIRKSFQLDLSTGDVLSVTTVRSLILLVLIGLARSPKERNETDWL